MGIIDPNKPYYAASPVLTAEGATQIAISQIADKTPLYVGLAQVAIPGIATPRNLNDALPDIFGGSDALARLYFGVKADVF